MCDSVPKGVSKWAIVFQKPKVNRRERLWAIENGRIHRSPFFCRSHFAKASNDWHSFVRRCMANLPTRSYPEDLSYATALPSVLSTSRPESKWVMVAQRISVNVAYLLWYCGTLNLYHNLTSHNLGWIGCVQWTAQGGQISLASLFLSYPKVFSKGSNSADTTRCDWRYLRMKQTIW